MFPCFSHPPHPNALFIMKQPDPIGDGFGQPAIIEAAGPNCIVPGQVIMPRNLLRVKPSSNPFESHNHQQPPPPTTIHRHHHLSVCLTLTLTPATTIVRVSEPPTLTVAAPLPISSPLQQRRHTVVRMKSAVAVVKLAALSATVSGSLPFHLRWPLSQRHHYRLEKDLSGVAVLSDGLRLFYLILLFIGFAFAFEIFDSCLRFFLVGLVSWPSCMPRIFNFELTLVPKL
ncbi:hypothetical protein PIB30_037183 [Stylosanthes scabra]|uniref:Uncharacterized protein n=1 Tax=Stylosanthes scabra TaxID=79078 RepID=A0ABU6VCA3_9FABA|nr:hypothetical protein [Stylosanthes scabra]